MPPWIPIKGTRPTDQIKYVATIIVFKTKKL